MMRVDFLEQKIPVNLSSRDEGGPSGMKIFWWTCHRMRRVDSLEQKILVNLSSRGKGGLSGTKSFG
jgi:hypothetical protein